MRRRSFDDRVRDLVREDDAGPAAGRGLQRAAAPFDAPLMDTLARAVTLPMPRRRAIGLMTGALVAAGTWRPGRARAAVTCSGTTPLKCEAPGGAAVCVPADWVCCSNDKCALACKPWEACASGTCSDTPKICGYPNGPFANKAARPKYCSITGPNATYCTGNQPVSVTSAWCCRAGETCGTEYGVCTCAKEICGDQCCKDGEYCYGGDTCVTYCPGRKEHCSGICCTQTETCSFFGCTCPFGKVRSGVDCVEPKDDPGDPSPNPLRNFINTIMQTSAAHRGKHSAFARPAQSGSPAVDAALDALAAVSGQGAAAMVSIRSGKPDPLFKRKVSVARAKPPTLVAGPGLDANSAAALNKLLVAEAKANALIAAMSKALWRARAARAKRNAPLAKRQLRASAAFAGQAATALKGIQSLRTAAAQALTAGGVAEVSAAEDTVKAFLASVRSSGIPSSLRTPLSKLGVGSTDLARLRTGLLEQTVTSGTGPALIAPLTNATRATELKQLTSELSKFSTRARRHPIAA